MPYESPLLIDRDAIFTKFAAVRDDSERLAGPLSPEDCLLQSMPDASPVKWNLAHTSWFFETFILKAHFLGYEVFHPRFGYLFNSYYNKVGDRHPRPDRGLVSRPSLDEVFAYRRHVNAAIERFLQKAPESVVVATAPLFAVGFAHEEQHQELLLTDLKHAMFQNPLAPAIYDLDAAPVENAPPLRWEKMPAGLCDIGADGDGFSFDNEGPRHKVFLHPFELSNRAVTNGDYIDFIEDGGYENPEYWLADAWDMVGREGWRAPLYWMKDGDAWSEYTLFGAMPVNRNAPVAHVSFYEADAYASWAGARLPTEYEWEAASSLFECDGRFLRNGRPRPPAPAAGHERLLQMFGDVWEWTASPYIAYPGFMPPAGAIGEYNGKFMSGQMVLKGGSCATPCGHVRPSYRNFFPPQARWQFSGFRLARDA
ncbi:MAG: ergothioneine biosynthesis protein EgtB [Pseudomonadota bacterium]